MNPKKAKALNTEALKKYYRSILRHLRKHQDFGYSTIVKRQYLQIVSAELYTRGITPFYFSGKN